MQWFVLGEGFGGCLLEVIWQFVGSWQQYVLVVWDEIGVQFGGSEGWVGQYVVEEGQVGMYFVDQGFVEYGQQVQVCFFVVFVLGDQFVQYGVVEG